MFCSALAGLFVAALPRCDCQQKCPRIHTCANLKPIIIVFAGSASTFRFSVCSFISCLYDLCNVSCMYQSCMSSSTPCMYLCNKDVLKQNVNNEKKRRRIYEVQKEKEKKKRKKRGGGGGAESEI